MALPKGNRLSARADIQEVFDKGKTVRHSFFFIKWHRNSVGCMRFAVIVPKSVAPKAHDRVAYKRLILSSLPRIDHTAPQLDVLIVLTAFILKKAHHEIKEEIDKKIKELWVKS